MDAATLRPECERCAALCCIAFAAEKSAAFNADKAAGEPCPNLDACGQCKIYDQRLDRGFGGCIQYDCLGAGQRVVQQHFAGRTWMDDPDLLAPTLAAFALVRQAHKLASLLVTAGLANLSPDDRAALEGLLAELDAVADVALQPTAPSRLGELEGRVRSFLTSLRRYFKVA
jgi:hypothetical protein